MAARSESLYRDAPFEALDRIDEASVPDCGSGAIARLRAENERHEQVLWYLSSALWMTLSICMLGIAAFRQAPYIVLVGFLAARDVIIILWVSRSRAESAQKAIDEITILQGADRIAREERLRTSIAAWNAEREEWRVRMENSEWLSSRQGRLQRDAYQLRERRRFLIAEIVAFKGGGYDAA